MEAVRKIVSQRLRKGAAEPHPDANLLAAFSEDALGNSERAKVLQHLACCKECREVVSFALPEVTASTAASAGRQSTWIRWPVLRWGAAAACVIVVGAAVTLHYQNREAPSVVPESGVTGRDEVTLAQPGVANAPPVASLADKERPVQRESNEPASKKALKSKVAAGAGNVPVAPARNAPAQATTEMAQATPSKDLDKLNTPASRQNVAVAANELAKTESAPSVPAEVAELAPGKAKEPAAPSPSAGASGRLDQGAVVGGTMKRQMAAAGLTRDESKLSFAAKLLPRWTLSADGTLQRSLDSGKTWQVVSVPGHSTLRALAAVGPDIWVGGTGGALYHSFDSGEHWSVVKPSVDGEALSSDIIGVEFTTVLRGKVTTADREVWTTTDAGKSWHKQ